MNDTSGESKSERIAKLGFDPQKEILYNHYLPYNEQLDSESVHYLSLIKANIARSIALNDPHGFLWTSDLTKYIRMYGYAFSKDDHRYFVKTLYEIILIPDLELNRIASNANVLTLLLKKRELLSPDDLTLEWRPLYELYERTLYSSYENLGMLLIPDNYESSLKNMIRAVKVYFPVESTREMLEEWRPLLCPYDQSMAKGTAYLELFLPTSLLPHQFQYGFKLWFDEFMLIWNSCQNSPLWEQNIIWLFSRLANDTIGYIDWDPYIPLIFTHLIRSFNLMGKTNKVEVSRGYNVFEINSVVHLITAMLGGQSKCQMHLTQLFKAVESYYHPSNVGRWNLKLQQLLYKLPSAFVNRLHRERYKKPSWRLEIPESHKLTEKDITDFVNSLNNVTMLSMFSRFGSAESASTLQNLAILRPEIVIPPVLEKLYDALETLTEPHRLTATMSCVVSIARPLVRGGKYFPEGPTHVMPLLMSSLNGLDVNDIRKCMVTFQFISTFATLIPIIDCSSAVDIRDDLSETEVQICLATAQFEDFVLQFLDRCFVLIENSALEPVNRLDNQDNDRFNAEEGMIEVGLASTFGSILLQCSPSIYESALSKLHSFVSSHIFETKVAGKFAAILVRSCSKANAELSLRKFLPHFAKLVLTLTENEDIIKDEILDHELLFSLLLVSEVVRCDARYLLEYKELIFKVLDRVLHMTCRKGYSLGSSLLKHVLKALTQIHALDFRSISKPWSKYSQFDDELPIRDWGSVTDLHTLNAEWHVPSKDELQFAQQIIERYLKQELESLNMWVKGEKKITREELQRTMHIILDCVNGSASALPIWDGENIVLYDTLVGINISRVEHCGNESIAFTDGSNIRQKIIETLRITLKHINLTCEDDTKSISLLLKIYQQIFTFWGVSKNEFSARWKGFHVVKKALENKLVRKKQHIRALIVDRLMLQHEMRLLQKSVTPFTEIHRDLMSDLFLLSTSHYTEIRIRAQEALNACFRYFPYCYRVILPDVLKNLSKDNDISHEQLKGTLMLIVGQRGRSLLTAHDWSTVVDLWPALVNSPNSEKPSIINLIDIDITRHVKKYFDTITLSFVVPKRCVDAAITVWTENKSLPVPALPCPTDEEIIRAKEKAKTRNAKNVLHYETVVNRLVSLIDDGNLHWRYHQMAFMLLSMLIRYDIPFPPNAVKVFVKGLIHDTIYIRKISISTFAAILKQQKPKHLKEEMNPIPLDNNWLQFERDFQLRDEKTFESTIFIDKPHIGFYQFPKPLMIYSKKQPKLERAHHELNNREIVIYESFTDQKFVDSFLGFLSLEENKGKDKFSAKRFHLWKGLFRNFGCTFIAQIRDKIKDYVTDKNESAHRCAAELIAGLVRGSKHWDYKSLNVMIEFLEPVIKQVYSNITVETISDWGTCSATIFENRDSRRLTWIMNIFVDDPLKDGGGSLSSFLQSSRLYLLLGAIHQQEWKGQKLLKQILAYLEEKHLTHSYQNVRERIGSILCNIFAYDIKIPCMTKTLDYAPSRTEFIEKILPKLESLRNDYVNDKREKSDSGDVSVKNGFTHESQERKDALNLLKTVSRWITGSVPRTNYAAPPEIFKFLPILCMMQCETTDEELVRETYVAIIMLSYALLTPEAIQSAIDTAKEITMAPNWHARSAIATFLQYMVSSNLFLLMSNKTWVFDITKLIIRLLGDERVEVRESTSETLSGLLHCEFIKIDDSLINTFMAKANHMLTKRKQTNGTAIVDPNDIAIRHSGILGLCACVNAFPYDVPEFMPKVIMFMSDHLNDPQPIMKTIKKTLSNFKRTHHDSWRDHKLKFTEDQLSVITDLLVSPSYYA